ncbi:hypothetical protein TorRG33x02_235720, partial [Trema orientale]
LAYDFDIHRNMFPKALGFRLVKAVNALFSPEVVSINQIHEEASFDNTKAIMRSLSPSKYLVKNVSFGGYPHPIEF